MRIYKMTATFGKLEHETLTLEPGLNVITAPNEWGKSTWCAFLAAMFYGLDTRAKTTKSALADKERYLPWSGSPMSGRIDLNWNGRDITIERSTSRRIPLGDFKAYETASGIPVPELTAANCGQMLLGVEQTVFRRAGFVRHADLPVTQDEALRRRLNALVTTGDESGACDRLAANLRDLKNRCRYNRSGLIPQTEAERDGLSATITELDSLDAQSKKIRGNLEAMKDMLSQLYNHQQALAYTKYQADLKQVAQAKEVRDQADALLHAREADCAELPPMEEAEQKVKELRAFREQWRAIMQEQSQLPAQPQAPQMPEPFTGMSPDAAREMAKKDAKAYTSVNSTRAPLVLIIMGLAGLAAAGLLVYLMAYIFAAAAGSAALIAFGWGLWESISMKRQSKALVKKYGSANWKRWADPVGLYERELPDYQRELKEYKEIVHDLEVRLMVLRKRRDALCGTRDPEKLLEVWQQTVAAWQSCYSARREFSRAQSHYEALDAMVKPVEKPTKPDHLTHSESETTRLLTECAQEQQRLQNRLGQYQGRMALLGDREELRKQLEAKRKRLAKLEETYAALVIAQDTLAQAKAELQRRFAPRITKRAQELLGTMTDGRYRRILMRDDFSLQAGTASEDVIRDALWRSDGTMDQLYLALRLAVAEELTPNAPLVLDDVLVRFDDKRMRSAVKLLRSMSREKQIILFTCQGREEEA